MQYASLATIHTVQAEFIAVLHTVATLIVVTLVIVIAVVCAEAWPEKPKKRRP